MSPGGGLGLRPLREEPFFAASLALQNKGQIGLGKRSGILKRGKKNRVRQKRGRGKRRKKKEKGEKRGKKRGKEGKREKKRGKRGKKRENQGF